MGGIVGLIEGILTLITVGTVILVGIWGAIIGGWALLESILHINKKIKK
jgi:hypothetical protein